MVRTAILTEFMLTIALLLQLIVLAFAVMIDTYLRKGQRKAMLIIVSLTFLLVAQNMAEYLMVFYTAEPFGRTVTAIIGYSIRTIIIVMFFDIIEHKEKKRWMWFLVVLNTLIHLTSFFSKSAYKEVDASERIESASSERREIVDDDFPFIQFLSGRRGLDESFVCQRDVEFPSTCFA